MILKNIFASLNPSFSGISFRTKITILIEVGAMGLNPSFSGISFRTAAGGTRMLRPAMCLNPSFSGISFRTRLCFYTSVFQYDK